MQKLYKGSECCRLYTEHHKAWQYDRHVMLDLRAFRTPLSMMEAPKLQQCLTQHSKGSSPLQLPQQQPFPSELE